MASQSTKIGGPAEFPMFARLPKELRLMIWKKILPGPRLLEIKYHYGNCEDDGPIMRGYFDFDCPVPALFSACKESYDEFRHQYSITFPRMAHGPKLHFDPAIDTLVIARRTRQTTRGYADDEDDESDPLIYPGGDVFNELENICFISFNLRSALRFLRSVETFEGYLRVKTITVAVESERTEWSLELDAKIGQPSLEEMQQTEGEQERCRCVIACFLGVYNERFPNRVLPAVKVMAIRRREFSSEDML